MNLMRELWPKYRQKRFEDAVSVLANMGSEFVNSLTYTNKAGKRYGASFHYDRLPYRALAFGIQHKTLPMDIFWPTGYC